MYSLLKIFSLMLLVNYSYQPALACSSCGSGATDPIVLFPNENYKFYLGISRQTRIRDITSQGKVSKTPGLKTKSIANVSAAARIGKSAAFVSLTSGYMINESQNSQAEGLTDPLLALRYNLIAQSFMEPWIPQVQLLAAHKHSRRRSIHQASHRELLDIFGTGFSESSLGSDIWFGMWPIKFGASLLWTKPYEDEKNGVKLAPGSRWTQIYTVGYVHNNELKLIGGWIRSESGPLRHGDNEVANSDKKDRSWYLTGETLTWSPVNIRLTITEQGPWSAKNSASFSSVTIALMKGWQ